MPLPRAEIPQMVSVRQELPRERLDDVAGAVRQAFARGGVGERVRAGQRIAITAGSRGIADIQLVIATVVAELRRLGAEPFVVPAMGSHGGATVEGQRGVLAEYGITEREVGAPVLASMETVVIGQLEDGTSVHLDKHAHDADGIVVVGRVKPHTAFRGDIESGLCKMTAIGLGKQRGAQAIHARGLRDSIPEVARVTLARANVVLGLALVENAYHQLHTIEQANPGEFHDTDRRLLVVANGLLARVPFDELDVLVVGELGKNISGSGMDYNVVGMWRRIGGEKRPLYKRVVVLDITPESEGNGLGIGIADFTTRRLFTKLDLGKGYMNALTANAPETVKIPVILESDREAIEVALHSSNSRAPRVVWIKNTLALEELLVSEALLPDVAGLPTLSVAGEPGPLAFDGD
ncbi:MAG: DUF2088 domain-containing protein, partial [Chloroflexi bacterium]|nr:DUF2088 domain-containing protein [Chloroflexota bacterium]